MLLGALPPPYGGQEAMTELLLIAARASAGLAVSFFDTSKPLRNDERGHLRAKNVRVNVAQLFGFARRVLSVRPTLVWLSLAQNRTGFVRDAAYVLVAKAARSQVVLHFQGGSFDRFYERRGALFRWLIRTTLRRARAIVVEAESVERQFTAIEPRLRLLRLYNSLAANWSDRLMNAGRRDGEVCVVLFVGHVSEAKGALDLVRAIALLREQTDRPTSFRFVGQIVRDDANVEFLAGQRAQVTAPELAHQLGLDGNVEFLGALPRDVTLDLLRAADVFALPSYSEGFSISMLEALAAGLPLVMTPVGAAPELLRDGTNCVFVTPGDVRGLAHAVQRLVEDAALRRRMGAANRDLFSSTLSEARFIEDFGSIIESLTRESGDA